MVSDLQHVDRRQQVAGEQGGLNRRFGIPGEQSRKAAMAQQEHDRSVVDVAVRQRSPSIHLAGIENLDRCGRVKRHHLPRPSNCQRDRRVCRVGQQAIVGRIFVTESGVQDCADAEALENLQQAGDVVLVWMAQDEQVDASREEGQVRAQPPQRELRVRAAIHKHGCAARSLDQNGVALADIEHGHVQPAIGE